MIGEAGQILCLDRDSQNIDFAEQNLSVAGLNNFSLEMGDFERAIDLIEGYDVALIFNALCYVQDHADFIRRLRAAARPGTRIIVKDFDMGAFVFGNVCPQKWGELIAAAMRGDAADNPLPYKNFFGRDVHFIKRCADFSRSKNMVWTQHINAPFTPSAVEYIWENVRSLLDQSININREISDYFINMFNVNNGLFFRDSASFFIETEFVTVLTV
jgi:SAM-dependent methyltransferase